MSFGVLLLVSNSICMIRCILIGIFMSIGQCYAQKETYHWFFEQGVHLDFSNGMKMSLDGRIYKHDMYGARANSSISDRNGKLLMYTNSVNVFNAQHQVMKGGEKIKGALCNFGVNSLIFPIDESGYLYYILTCSNGIYNSCEEKEYMYDTLMYYHIVDMRLQNGLGEVISKNNVVSNTFHTTLSAVKHRNGYDTWVLAPQTNSNHYYAYLFTSCGLSKTVVSEVNGYMFPASNEVKILLSPNGKLIGMPKFDTLLRIPPYGKDYFYLDKFNDSTGEVTSWLKLRKGRALVANFAFSPDSRYLYYQYAGSECSQHDLVSGDSATIMQSEVKYASTGNAYSALQNMPDGRMMFSIYNLDYPYNGIFEYPNRKCPDCNLDEKGISLPKSSKPQSYPTYFMSSFFRPGYKTPEPFNLNPSIETKTLACAYDSVHLKGNSTDAKTDSLVWVIQNINGDTLKRHKGKEWKTWLPVGTYTATLTAWRSCVNTSAKIEFVLEDKPIARINDKTQDTVYHCANTPIILRANEGNYAYLWGNGAKEQEIEVTQSGQYTLLNSNTCGSAFANIVVQEDIRTVPNVITPNGDGINDTWNISNKSGQPFSVKIINRWGGELFSSSDYKNDFGTDVMAGMYFYLITQKGDCHEKGWLEVVK